ncbi:hypothetical protein PV326_008370 [Microctonus aethiopoides]|nr:hypothetical protein PV326_008370 [Microctonus aethiopoides]
MELGGVGYVHSMLALHHCECVKFVDLQVPQIVDPRSEKILLYCNYDLAGKGLFSVNWFKEDDEFFRYMANPIPGKPPIVDAYNVNGIRVNLDESNDKLVVLQQHEGDKWANLGGSYACQVTAEGPKFDVNFDVANISVGVLPQRDPALEGLRTHYDVGDLLTAECTSAPSYPPAELSFHLNNIPAKKASTIQLPDEGDVEGTVVSTTRLGLSVSLQRHDFNAVGSLSLVCRSILPGIPGVKARETRAIVYLTTSNEKLAQEAITKFSSSGATASISTTGGGDSVTIKHNIFVVAETKIYSDD